MNHDDHVRLIRPGIATAGGIWADLGSGTGAFTLALADILGPSAMVYSVDVDKNALAAQERALQARFPAVQVEYLLADFTRPLSLPPLDGIVMANSLHFLPNDRKPGVLRQIRQTLRPGGRLIVVEYNADQGNPWVPYPFSYATWIDLAQRGGFARTRLLTTVPSRFLGEIYSALST